MRYICYWWMKLWMVLLFYETCVVWRPVECESQTWNYMYTCEMWLLMMLMLMIILIWDDINVDDNVDMRWCGCWCWWEYWYKMMLMLIMTLRWNDVDVDDVIMMMYVVYVHEGFVANLGSTFVDDWVSWLVGW